MNLRTYIDLYQLLKEDRSTHESNRALALEKHLGGVSPRERLAAWVEAWQQSLPRPSWSVSWCRYLYGISLTLGILALVFGFFSGVALLSYNGTAPVNVIYFLALAVFVPLLTMFLALLAISRANRAESMLIHISPAYWMEKILGFLPGNREASSSAFRVSPLLLNWLVIKRAQLLALLFAIGLLLALLGIVVTKDVAFAWSTTLHLSPEGFHHFLETLAWPWRAWLPSAVPSLELIEQSQYFRLGGKLGSDMVAHAGLLGEWWKFLACATLFYAILLRFVLWLMARYGFQKALSRSLLKLEGAERLLYQMDTAIVTTTAPGHEPAFVQKEGAYGRIVYRGEARYAAVLGWAMDDKMIALLNDSLEIEAVQRFAVGGSRTLHEDTVVLKEVGTEVLLYVKAWEPPTMDFIDFLHALAERATRITVMPVGTEAEGYMAGAKSMNIWARKLLEINHPKVWLWHNS